MNTTAKIVITLDHDPDTENPSSYDGWTPYSFSREHSNYRDPDEVDPDEDEELRAKLASGLAFPLSYFEHGQCIWSLQGEGPQCRWDSVQNAGLLVWEEDTDNIGAKTVEDRAKDAERFLKNYTLWCNGETYCFSAVEVSDCSACGQEEEGDDAGGCGGFIGADDLFSYIRAELGDGPFDWRGEAKNLVTESDWEKAK